ncbi:hypothetical protein CI109_107332 [Kwoniella shandongensis]|uniref:Mediator of RNA polymerase II transcription subunit 14 n=1 Tax=Kwoniella shandongensis TaxID=1734106 RepID=A0A5M6BWA3_9TREE|nr:uncharacterized protein CI109_004740 [Kwoniella shandongensis]KAA5526963.1 hypothetical protein CI109_004740 [Kwoniella shandongensis]
MTSTSLNGVASTSTLPPPPVSVAPSNPQLGPEPYFAYPTPTEDQIEDELPPYFESENVALGPLLDRLVRKGYGDLRLLVGEALPSLPAKQRPKHIIDYAKTTRQALLKYLAVLRWKAAADIASVQHSTSALPSTSQTNAHQTTGAASFPTPHSNGDSNDTSPGSFVGKGKAKAQPNDNDSVTVIRGKVTDAKRVQYYFQHQNSQHDSAVLHIRHVTKGIESLRERNPDLLTALSLLTTGTYNRLPTSLTDPYLSKPRLTNSAILKLLKRLNRQIRYRLRCLDYFPPELVVEDIRDGRMYAKGNGWRAEMTVVGFGEGARWWLTGVEWGWKVKEKGTDDPGGSGAETKAKRFEGDERQGILDLANLEVLAPKEVESLSSTDGEVVVETPGGSAEKPKPEDGDVETKEGQTVDAPLVRLYNFLQHLSLSYQLETLFSQAATLSQGKWRGQLIVEMDRTAKTLRIKYWIRPRPAQVQQQQQAAVGRKAPPPGSQGASRAPMVGGILSISLDETSAVQNEVETLLGGLSSGGMKPSERVLNLNLGVKWEIGEIGVGGGLKVGDLMDGSFVKIDPNSLSIEDLLSTATRAHAAHLTRTHTASLLASPRVIQTLLNQPTLRESDDLTLSLPLTLQIPLPSRNRLWSLHIGVSSHNGSIEIEDDGAIGNEARANRVKLATTSVNEGKSRLVDDVGRLTIAIITENMEDQMRLLGWQPTRRLALRSQDLGKADLHPATTIFVPLSSSTTHYFITKVTPNGVAFEALKLIRVTNDTGLGLKLAIGDRTTMDLDKLRARRKGGGERTGSTYEIDNRDLKDLYILCNALVAQTIVEQQLKDRSIPYTQQYPPTSGPGAPRSTSPLAGMVPTICVEVGDLLRGGVKGGGGGAALEVAMPRVCLQIEGWWKGGGCEVVTIVQLRHQPSMTSETGANAGLADERETDCESARAEGITFDPASSIVKFRAKDISRCVPSFLEQWERLSKVIVVAGEVNRLSKLDAFKDVKMLSFDLRKATLSYAKGYNASITYTPNNDSYQVTFFRDTPAPSLAPKADLDGAQDNTHDILAPLLSAKLNELTSSRRERVREGSVGREFVGLLKSTLPVLLVSQDMSKDGWNLVVMSVGGFRLVRDHERRRYALEVTLLPDLEHYLIQDAIAPRGPDAIVDTYTGDLTPIKMEEIVKAVFEKEKTTNASRLGKIPPLVRLDRGKSLMCEVGRVETVLRGMGKELDKSIGASRREDIKVE